MERPRLAMVLANAHPGKRLINQASSNYRPPHHQHHHLSLHDGTNGSWRKDTYSRYLMGSAAASRGHEHISTVSFVHGRYRHGAGYLGALSHIPCFQVITAVRTVTRSRNKCLTHLPPGRTPGATDDFSDLAQRSASSEGCDEAYRHEEQKRKEKKRAGHKQQVQTYLVKASPTREAQHFRGRPQTAYLLYCRVG